MIKLFKGLVPNHGQSQALEEFVCRLEASHTDQTQVNCSVTYAVAK